MINNSVPEMISEPISASEQEAKYTKMHPNMRDMPFGEHLKTAFSDPSQYRAFYDEAEENNKKRVESNDDEDDRNEGMRDDEGKKRGLEATGKVEESSKKLKIRASPESFQGFQSLSPSYTSLWDSYAPESTTDSQIFRTSRLLVGKEVLASCQGNIP